MRYGLLVQGHAHSASPTARSRVGARVELTVEGNARKDADDMTTPNRVRILVPPTSTTPPSSGS